MNRKMKRYEDGGEIKVERSGGIEEVLGTLSPLYGMATGKGMFGKNDLGILPTMARRMRRKEMESSDSPVKVSIEVEEDMDMEEPKMMRKGGMTKGSRDGCAIRGKTKGRMV